MSELLERRFVRCPYNLAKGYLARVIGSRVSHPGPLTLTLDVPGGRLVKHVVVTYEAAVDRMHFDEPWRVHWEPKAGPYPEFDGELTVRADENYSSSLLELKGSYRPPGGAFGAAFDEVLGKHVASATAQALLERLGGELEVCYAQDEKSKASSS
jgi:uncharacterized membrane protein